MGQLDSGQSGLDLSIGWCEQVQFDQCQNCLSFGLEIGSRIRKGNFSSISQLALLKQRNYLTLFQDCYPFNEGTVDYILPCQSLSIDIWYDWSWINMPNSTNIHGRTGTIRQNWSHCKCVIQYSLCFIWVFLFIFNFKMSISLQGHVFGSVGRLEPLCKLKVFL